MTELFDTYSSDFSSAFGQLKSVVELLQGSAGYKQDHIVSAQKCVTQADLALRQMMMEIHTMPPELTKNLSQKVSGYRNEFTLLKNEYSRIKQDLERLNLLHGNGLSIKGKSSQHRQRLLDTLEYANEGSQHLEESYRLALETEKISEDVTSNLRLQKESILRSSGNVRTLGSHLREGRTIVGNMARIALQNKLILYCVSAVLVIVIILIIVVRFT